LRGRRDRFSNSFTKEDRRKEGETAVSSAEGENKSPAARSSRLLRSTYETGERKGREEGRAFFFERERKRRLAHFTDRSRGGKNWEKRKEGTGRDISPLHASYAGEKKKKGGEG